MTLKEVPAGVEVRGAMAPGYETILTPDALAFLATLTRALRPRVEEALARRVKFQERLDAGEMPDFLPETRAIRESDWQVAPLPADLLDRRVEITGPVDRKMVINALNSGAKVFMADFEDANSPTWDNCVSGQMNMRDAVRRTIDYDDPTNGKSYRLNPATAVLLVRPRGWHLVEKHVLIDGKPMSAGLFDFGLYFFHNAAYLADPKNNAVSKGPYFYLPKMEHHLEARIWNDAFVMAQSLLGLPIGTVKATVLVETMPAVFQLNEILWELREHSAGLNCGRWDYIFSFIKKFSKNTSRGVYPDRAQVSMEQPFMRAYTQLVVKTCHRRNVHAMGGMAAQIPIKNDPAASEAALARVRADKLREVKDGHDGTWVAHPGLVPVAMAIFDEHMKTPNQLHVKRDDFSCEAKDLYAMPKGTCSEATLRANIRVGVQYIEAWLRGVGCVPLYNLMEDAATAEISRAQVWEWLRSGVTLDNGVTLDAAYFKKVSDEEMAVIRGEIGEARFASGKFAEARGLFDEMSLAPTCPEFLTSVAYERYF